MSSDSSNVLARVAGVISVWLFVSLLIAHGLRDSDPDAGRIEMCTVGSGPEIDRDELVGRAFSKLIEAEPADRDAAIFEYVSLEPDGDGTVMLLGGWVQNDANETAARALAVLGEAGASVLRASSSVENEQARQTAALGFESIKDPSDEDLRRMCDLIVENVPNSAQLVSRLAATGPRAVPCLMKMVRSDDERTRLVSQQLAAEIGVDAVDALAAALPALEDAAYATCLDALGRIGEDARGAASGVAAELPRRPPWEQRPLFHTLALIDAALTPDTQDRFIAYMESKDFEPTREWECALLGYCATQRDKAHRYLRVSKSVEASFALWRLDGVTDEVLQSWRASLGSGDEQTVAAAILGLRRVGSDALPVLPQLARAHAPWLQEYAAEWVFAACGVDAVPTLMSMLDNRSAAHVAMRALWELGPKAAASAEKLRSIAKSGNPVALWALGSVAPDSEATAAAVAEAFDGTDLQRRVAIAVAEQLGPRARAAGPKFVEWFLAHPEEYSYQIGIALGRMGYVTPEVLAFFVGWLESSDRRNRTLAARVLLAMGPRARAAERSLRRATRDCYPSVRLLARLALGAATDDPGPARELLRDPKHAAETVAALAASGVEDGRLVPDIERLATRGSGRNRRAALLFLTRMGPRARAAAPGLRALADDADAPPSVRKAARDALKAIEGTR
ncbi:MAG: hypothetical protein ACYTGZ_09795 [Planctomycetota bacterium]|jgi:hypothetical protein